MTTRYPKIAITLPAADLAAADRLARLQDRSRSWIIAEALRRYVADQERAPAETLDAARHEQLRRDLALTAEQRLLEAEDVAADAAEDIAVVSRSGPYALEQPRVFASYDEFAAWRRDRLPA